MLSLGYNGGGYELTLMPKFATGDGPKTDGGSLGTN